MKKQSRFLTNGTLIKDKMITKCVGLRFNEASHTLEKGQKVTVRPIEVQGYKDVLGVFNRNGQVGNIIATKTYNEIEYEARGGKVYTNKELIKDLDRLSFEVKSVGKYGAVLTASFN